MSHAIIFITHYMFQHQVKISFRNFYIVCTFNMKSDLKLPGILVVDFCIFVHGTLLCFQGIYLHLININISIEIW